MSAAMSAQSSSRREHRSRPLSALPAPLQVDDGLTRVPLGGIIVTFAGPVGGAGIVSGGTAVTAVMERSLCRNGKRDGRRAVRQTGDGRGA
ncbi:MAG: hypothetical protein MZV70_01050 [Desulfobacterales bacterium]|nr:hypothetical protein [Desulfobacterales bacterium]